MALVAIRIITLLFIWQVIAFEDVTADCDNGFIQLDMLRTVAQKISGGTESKNRLSNELRLIPDWNFTCNDTITGFLLGVDIRSSGVSLYPEVQIWRRTDPSSLYVKVWSEEIRLNAGSFSPSGVLEYHLSNPFNFQAGDIFGVFQSSHSSSIVRTYYNSNDNTAPVAYVQTGSSSKSVSVFSMDDSDFSMVEQEFLLITPTADTPCTSGFPSPATLQSKTYTVNIFDDVAQLGEQRVFPDINFTCSGNLTKWIVGGTVGNKIGGEIQIWRRNAGSVNDYTKVGFSILLSTDPENDDVYEYVPDPPLEFQEGDILGVYQRGGGGRMRVYYQETTGPENYRHTINLNIDPPAPATLNGPTLVVSEYDYPLVTVEIAVSSPTSSSQVPLSSKTTSIEPSMTASSTDIAVTSSSTSSIHHVQSTVNSADFSTSFSSTVMTTPTSSIKESLETALAEISPTSSELAISSPTSSTISPLSSKLASTSIIMEYQVSQTSSELQSMNSLTSTDVQILTSENSMKVTSSTTFVISVLTSNIPSMLPSETSIGVIASSETDIDRSTKIIASVSAVTSMFTQADGIPSPSTDDIPSPSTDDIPSPSTDSIPSPSTDDIPSPSTDSIPSPSTDSIPSPSTDSIPSPSTDDIPSSSTDSIPSPSTDSLVESIISMDETNTFTSQTRIFISTTSRPESSQLPAVGVSGAAVGAIAALLILAVIAAAGIIILFVVFVRRRMFKSAVLIIDNPQFTNPLYQEATMKTGKDEFEGCYMSVPFDFTESNIYEECEDLLQHRHQNTHAECEQDSTTVIDNTDYYTPVQPTANVEPLYWTPADDCSGIYEQLSSKGFRELTAEKIRTTTKIGSGQFGCVNKGVWHSPEGPVDVAIKTLKPESPEEEKIKFLQEAAIMGQFHHPNIVKLHGVVTVEEPTMIVLELMKQDLREQLFTLRPSSGELAPSSLPQQLLGYCRQIASGMEYLSKKSFVHRDLAARNILVDDERTCKIADFGMSRDLEDDNYYTSRGGVIPMKWTAIEALLYKKYSTASDVWSFGVLMYEIWSLGHKPFENITNANAFETVRNGVRLSPPPGCPRAIYELMIQCWHPETSKRPSFSSLVYRLSQPQNQLLHVQWADDHSPSSMLGAPLEAGINLHSDLQEQYLQ